LIGEVIARGFALRMPGPVVGPMLLLLLARNHVVPLARGPLRWSACFPALR
jgi:putative effector of murein hydrolase LrgA (UPF0299 family)